MKTLLLPPTKKSFEQASRILANGGLVAFPTETVYGLGADAHNPAAVTKVYEVKKRPSSNPLIVHVKDLNMAAKLAEFDTISHQLANRFWPGPLTLILPQKKSSKIPGSVTANSGYIAIRVPTNPIILELIDAFGKPIVGPSANLSGKISSTSTAHVLSDLAGKIEAIVDGGDCAMGLESTILMYDHPNLQILRLGIIPLEKIRSEISDLQITTSLDGVRVPSPGSKFRHYSPDKPIRINCLMKEPNEFYLGFGPTIGADLNLSEYGELAEAAKNLYQMLRMADQQAKFMELRGIAVAPIPNIGVGMSINDRLERAAKKDYFGLTS